MAKIRVDGQEVELVTDWRFGELMRAENALDVDMDGAKGAARRALIVFMSLARQEPWKTMQPGSLADLVMRMELATFAEATEEDEAGPPAEEPDPDSEDPGAGSENGEPQTAGILRSA